MTAAGLIAVAFAVAVDVVATVDHGVAAGVVAHAHALDNIADEHAAAVDAGSAGVVSAVADDEQVEVQCLDFVD